MPKRTVIIWMVIFLCSGVAVWKAVEWQFKSEVEKTCLAAEEKTGKPYQYVTGISASYVSVTSDRIGECFCMYPPKPLPSNVCRCANFPDILRITMSLITSTIVNGQSTIEVTSGYHPANIVRKLADAIKEGDLVEFCGIMRESSYSKQNTVFVIDDISTLKVKHSGE